MLIGVNLAAIAPIAISQRKKVSRGDGGNRLVSCIILIIFGTQFSKSCQIFNWSTHWPGNWAKNSILSA
jgi:hypothetical protein